MTFDFDNAVQAPFRMQPGLRKLASGALHLAPSAPGSRHMREKLAVLSAHWPKALRCEPDFDPLPALQRLAAVAAREHPGHFGWDGHQATALGVSVRDGHIVERGAGVFGHGDEVPRCLDGLPSDWRLAGLLSLAFQDDFAIVDGAQARVPWMAVALPSHWAPERKQGVHFTELHAPVADGGALRTAGRHLLALVSGQDAYERFVWTITAHPRLNAHPDHVDPAGWPAGADAVAIGAAAWFRTERQSFLPLADRREAVFTIRVQTQPLAAAAVPPDRAARLHDAVSTMSEAVLAYRNLAGVREPLLQWLAQQASAETQPPA
ncbi:MAG: heme-dependent oxidative N-demethylase subunit alpha family protein [Aquabacterium sp.]